MHNSFVQKVGLMPYHVVIDRKQIPSPEIKFDLTNEKLEERVLAPYRLGQPIVIGGKTIPLDDIERIRIYWTDAMSAKVLERARLDPRTGPFDVPVIQAVTNQGKDVTDDLIIGPPGSQADSRHQDVATRVQDPRMVFVVHGRNTKAREAIFAFLRSIQLTPLEWSQWVKATGKSTPYVGDVLDTAFSKAQAVVVLMTPDDETRLRKQFRSPSDLEYETKLTPQARPNVLFEAGMAMGKFANRTVLVEWGKLRPFSDIGGRLVVKLNDSSEKRQELAKRLETAGCPVNLEGTDWHSAGNFGISKPRATRARQPRPKPRAKLRPIKNNVSRGHEFLESFRHDLSAWEIYDGSWHIEEENGQRILDVTESGLGGIAKPCVGWTNYEFEFETKIVNKYTSWIIRAKDTDNYVMLQCQKDTIFPHFRFEGGYPTRDSVTRKNPIPLSVTLPVGVWFGVRIVVRNKGVTVTLVVDGKKIDIHNIPHSLLAPPFAPTEYLTGSVGFRESSDERACFRNITVRQI